MRVMLMSLLVLACACSGMPSSATDVATPASMARPAPQSAADDLLAADRSFSAASNTDGVAAMRGMFDREVAVFAIPVPGFARGPEEAAARIAQALGADNARLERTPIRVGVSADGQQGFSFGYTTARVEGQPDRHGKYVAYWVRRPEGWRAVLFKLVPRAEGDVSLDMLAPSLPRHGLETRTDAELIASHRDSLARREQAFSDAAQTIGLRAAFQQFGRADAVNVGGGPEFSFGPEQISSTQPEGPSSITWSADQGVFVASSGDLGATWGYLRRIGPVPPGRLAQIPFFTIWRRDAPTAEWLYIAE